ncbi:hypothetical protein ACOME3_007568 [Neoechinorhynchus agilis]
MSIKRNTELFWQSNDGDYSEEFVISANNMLSVRVTSDDKLVQQIAIKRRNENDEVFLRVGSDEPIGEIIEKRNQIVSGIKAAIKRRSSCPLAAANQKIRARILATNKSLAILFNQLVVGGIISNQQFWMEYIDETSIQLIKNVQQQTLPTGLITPLKVSVSKDGKTVVDLPPELITTIFHLNPSVREKYLECVPGKMSDNRFWADYMKCLLAGDADPHDALLFQMGDARMAILEAIEENEDVIEEIRRKMLGPEDHQKTTEKKKETSISQLMNLHSIRMLRNVAPCPKYVGKTPSKESTELEPKQEKVEWSAHVRHILPSFENQDDISVHFASTCSARIDEDFFDSGDRGHGMNTVKSASTTVAKWYRQMQEKKRSHKEKNIFELDPQVNQAVISANEMLSHFWKCFPVTNSALGNKLVSFGMQLKKFRDKRVSVLLAKVSEECDIAALTQSREMLDFGIEAFKRYMSTIGQIGDFSQ